MTQIIRLVSINIWDLPIHIPFGDRHRRRRHLLKQLPQLNADLVFVQEAFRPGFRERLREHMAYSHWAPHPDPSRRVLWMHMDRHGGLMTLSRWPIEQATFQRWCTPPSMRIDERIGGKGCLWTRIATPAGQLLVGNVHMYAGNALRDARARRAQTHELLRRGALDKTTPTLLMGDFNMARDVEIPHRGRTGFDLLDAYGLEEIAGGSTRDLATMAPRKNRYAAFVQRVRHGRRLTQVFLRGLRPGPTPPSICLDNPPVSDHFGLAAELQMNRTPQEE